MCKIKKVDCPCIKLPPPHVTLVSSRQGPLRVPTPYDAIIAPRDALLLNGAFHALGHTPLIASFFKQLARVYGELIPHRTLRHAVLACTAAQLLPEREGQERLEYHKRQASSQIRQLKSSAMVADADVFAAFLLAWVTHRNSIQLQTAEGSIAESHVHARGCGAMMGSVIEHGTDTPFLRIFKGLVWDKMSWMVSTTDSSRSVFMTPMSSFDDRVRYFEQLCMTGTPTDAWKSAPLEAVNDYLCDLLRTSLVWFHDIAMEESFSPLDARTIPVGTAEYIWERLSDVELHRVIWILKQSLKETIPDSDRQIIQLQFAQLRTTQLLHSIFKSSTIAEGIGTLETEIKVLELLHELKFQPRLSAPLTEYYYDYSYIGIAIAGLTVSKEDGLQRILL